MRLSTRIWFVNDRPPSPQPTPLPPMVNYIILADVIQERRQSTRPDPARPRDLQAHPIDHEGDHAAHQQLLHLLLPLPRQQQGQGQVHRTLPVPLRVLLHVRQTQQHTSLRNRIQESYHSPNAEQLTDMVVYYHLKENISSARKVFRLFRFFDEIKGLTKILKTDKPAAFKLLSVFTYCCSITYYISDNVLWLMNILVKSAVIPKSQSRSWKQKKNFSSFYRVVAYTLILIYSIYLQKGENEKNETFLVRQGEAAEANIEAEEKAYNKLLDGRRKIRFFILELFLSFFRFLMLTKSLKLRWH
jgi:hypothetical protein